MHLKHSDIHTNSTPVMAKRPRGKTAENFKKRAKSKTLVDETLVGFAWQALHSDEEIAPEDYELRPRKFRNEEEEIERLPIKHGARVQRVLERREKVESAKESEPEEEEEEKEEINGRDETEDDSEQDDSNDRDERGNMLSDRQIVLKTKEFIAECAEKLNEDSEENIGKLRDLRQYYPKTKSLSSKKILLLAMVPIYKNLIPGYRIRELTESEKTQKLSKDVKRLRNFEESLVTNYRAYIDTLKNLCKRVKGNGKSPDWSPRQVLAQVAIRCACELLESVPHFNFRNDLIEIIISRLSSRKLDASFYKCITTIEKVFDDDDEGHISFDIVRLLTKMIKVRRYKVDESILTALLHLRLLTELVAKADLEKVDLRAGKERPKIQKKDRVHFTKKERKARKENKLIEQELQKAETAVSSEERERLQGETLKLVFILYFNILKERVNHLIGVTLEGLAKFAHLINADLFGDLLEVIRELIQERQQTLQTDGFYEFNEFTTRESLLCIATAFALLAGQAGESMNLDLSFFVNHFYSALYSIALNPEIEFSHKTLRLDDPLEHQSVVASHRNKVNMSTETELVVQIFEAIFFKQRTSSRIRTQAFVKRLMTSSLHMPEKSCIASLKILDKMVKRYNVTALLFSPEDRINNGVYHMDVDIPDHSNPEAATIWETVLLEKHYSSTTARAAGMLAKAGERESKRF